jgi:fructose-1,6-bisphosphatase I
MMDDHPARRVTLQRHILESQRRHREATGELSVLLTQIAYAGKIFAHALGRAPLAGRLGATGGTNIQGEVTKKLDVFGNETITDAFATSELVAAVVSEEDDEPRQMACGPGAKYILCIDPLDGSSNSDINGVVGTIFGVYQPATGGAREADVAHLQSGRDQVAAGYIMYGPSTAFAYTTGEGLHGFTLDEDIGEYVLTHPGIRCPEAGSYYSANLANVPTWPSNARRYIEHLTDSTEAAHAYSLRYSGALVADVHRTVLEGGIYLYPCDLRHPDGKLRLLYECAPLAFVVEQAGGAASTGRARVLDVPIQSVHQRIPFAIGSRAELERFDSFMRSGA